METRVTIRDSWEKFKHWERKPKQPRGNWMVRCTRPPALWGSFPCLPPQCRFPQVSLGPLLFYCLAVSAVPGWTYVLSGHLYFHMLMISISISSRGPCSAPDLHTQLHTDVSTWPSAQHTFPTSDAGQASGRGVIITQLLTLGGVWLPSLLNNNDNNTSSTCYLQVLVRMK